MKRKWAYVFLTALFLVLLPAMICNAQNDDVDDDVTLSPYFFIESEDTSVDSFPLKETNVRANINGVIADIYVEQTYANEGTKPINASYVFPASTRVSVHGMRMIIGDNVIVAKIKEREEARQEFEQAKEEGKSASLLEQERPNVFSMSVANIMPGDIVRIELHYTELIVSTEKIYEFVFPTVVGPRYSNQLASEAPQDDQWVSSPYLHEGEVPPGKYNITVNISAGVPISDVKSSSHEINVTQESALSAKVTLANSEDFAGNRDYILRYRLTGEEIQCGLMLQKGDDENFFMLMVQPPERVEVANVPPREYIFVFDTSGSMDGFPLETAKELFSYLVLHLRETDSFNLILFSSSYILMSPKSIPATETNLKDAIKFIGDNFEGGGTEMIPALRKAVEIPKIEDVSRSFVIITDGYIDDEKTVFDIIKENLDNTNYFSFGIGNGVNRYLIEGIGDIGLGESFVVTDSFEAAEAADRLRMYIESPVLTSVNVKYVGFDACYIEPPNIPTLFADRPIVLFGKWRGEPTGSIRITGKTGSGDFVKEIQLSDIEISESNTAIGYLWARKKVERLIDYAGYWIPDEVRLEVIEIGLKYSMMTRFTSFVAVLETVRNDGESVDVAQPLPLPQGVADSAVGGNFAMPAAPAPGGYMPNPMSGDNWSYVIMAAALISLGAVILAGRRKRKI